MKTQKEMVLEFIKNAGSITAKEAFTELGITRLSARIFDLWKAGEDSPGAEVLHRERRQKQAL